MTLAEISDQIGVPHGVTKERRLYDLYERYFAPMRHESLTLMEIGVFTGESAKVFATYFQNARIVAVDCEQRNLDFSAYPRITFAQADQRRSDQLDAIVAAHAPGGLDVVIDDASHVGSWSWQSYCSLHPHLKPGGLYIIEDWATGYWDDWPDGSHFEELLPQMSPEAPPCKRMPSHDFGMVGFIKRLVDEAMWKGIRPSIQAPLTRPKRLEYMHVHPEFVVLQKALEP